MTDHVRFPADPVAATGAPGGEVPLARPAFATLTPAQARRERAFATLWSEEAIGDEGSAWTLAPLPPAFTAGTASTWRSIRTLAGPEILIPAGSMRLLLERRFPDVDLDGLGPDVEVLLVEASLQPVLAKLASVLATSLSIGSLGPSPSPVRAEAALALSTPEAGTIPLLLRADAPGKRRFDAWAFRLGRRRLRKRDLLLPVSFRLGTCELAFGRLAALRPGDGIVLDHADAVRSGCVAVVGERLAQRALPVAEGYRLSGPLLPIDRSLFNAFSRETTMSDVETSNSEDRLRDVPVRIVFELGRIEVPLGDLESLAEGYVFETGRRSDEAVDIVIGGRTVGKGDLVLVGEVLAVRVLRLDR